MYHLSINNILSLSLTFILAASKHTTEDDNTNVYIDNDVDNFPAGACYASGTADSIIITQKLLSKQNQIPQQLLHISVSLK